MMNPAAAAQPPEKKVGWSGGCRGRVGSAELFSGQASGSLTGFRGLDWTGWW